MAMKQGETYECTNPRCRCQISVTHGSEAASASQAPRCCCGEAMKPMQTSRSEDRM